MKLSYKDKEALLASALGMERWSIHDFNDDEVFYYSDKDQKTYMRSYAVLDGKVTLGDPAECVAHTEYKPVTAIASFSLDEAEFAGDEVILKGKVFEAGEYPDKNFSITPGEMQQAVAEFSPVSNDLEHKRTILDGKIGQLRSVIAKGKELIGEVAVPKWFYDAVGKEPIKASLAWNTQTKRIIGNGLVINPRVPDAQLVAAFNVATSDNTQGGNHLPIDETTKKLPLWQSLVALFSKGEKLPDDLKDVKLEDVASFAGEPTEPTPAPAQAPIAAPPDDDGQTAKFTAELEAEKAANAGLTTKLIKSEAEAFFSKALADCKVLPAEKDALVALFTQAVKDDNAGVACFSAAGELNEGIRVKALRDSIDARPKHNLTTETIDGNIVVLSANEPSGSTMTAERRAELLAAGSIKPVKES
jgi:hypothetical protein